MTGALIGFYRSLSRHRLFAALNIGGLALGIAAFLVLYVFVQFETGYDRHLPGWDKLWVIQERYTMPGYPPGWNPNTMGAELEQLHADYPDLVGTRFEQQAPIIRQGTTVSYGDFAAVDPGFFRLFPYPAVAGDPEATLARPDGLVIAQSYATKYFGTNPAIGRTLPLRFGATTRVYRVGAVIADIPDDESISAKMFARLDLPLFVRQNWSHWGSTHLTTVLRFPDAASGETFSRVQLPAFIDRHAFAGGEIRRGTYTQSLRPLADLHLFTAADRAVVATLGLVGLLTLVVAGVNYVNLATARTGLRAREVAVRKVLGGTRRALAAQFLGEALVTVALAALIGLALAECLLPLINSAGGTTLSIRYWGSGSILPALAALVLVVGLVAGSYPAFAISRFQPAAVLASARAPGGGRAGARLRQALVIAQFAVAISFAIGTMAMLAQIAHLRAADLGFRRDGLLLVGSYADEALDRAERSALLDAFRRLPGVTGATAGQNAPGGQPTTNSGGFARPDRPQDKISMMSVPVSPGYFDIYGGRLVAGRLFDRAHGLDDRATLGPKPKIGSNVVINSTAARALGFASPTAAIGRAILGDSGEPRRVIGVVTDLRFRTPREPVIPTVYTFNTATSYDAPMAAIRYSGMGERDILAEVEAAWKRVAPEVPFHAYTAERTLYESFYRDDERRARLFTLGGVLAIAIGCIGLYGLAAFDTARRVKEIGIRKTLGASTRDVLRLLLAKFLVPVLVANLLAWPIAYVVMQRWLSGFDDRIALSPVFFLVASLVALAIATLTVIGQSWRVAHAEPARALRYE